MQHDLDQMHLQPMDDAEYAQFIERSTRGYAEEYAANFDATIEQGREKSDKVFADLLPDGLGTPNQYLYSIRTRDGEAVGQVWLGLADKPGGLEAFGYEFWVRPELRDRGIGRRAMQLGADAARELGAVRVALNVFGDNERARHLYESFGFTTTSVQMAMRL